MLNRVGAVVTAPTLTFGSTVHHLRSRSFLAGRAALAAIIGLALGAAHAPAAFADDVEPPPIRWSVTPANEAGPDGRTFVENTLDPGESVEDYFAVRNVSDQTVEFSLKAADGFYSRTGRFDILPSDQESVDAGTWITLPDSVTVPGGQTVVVPFTIEVPELAEPGDHAAGITASILTVQEAEDGTAVGVESRVGFRVTTRVTGELTPKAAVQALSGDYSLSWNPFRPGEMTVTFEIANQGNTILLTEGVVDAGGQSALFPAEGENPEELLAGDTRTFSVVVGDVWPLFLVPTRATVAATVLTMGGDESTLTPVSAEILVWAIPWPQLIVLLGIALIVFAIVGGRIRSRRKVAALVADAKEQGRREAGVVGDDAVPASASASEAAKSPAADGTPQSRRAARSADEAP